MAKKKSSKAVNNAGLVFWIIIAIIGSAWLVYSGLRGYISYWRDYSFSQNFFDYLINPSAFELVKFLAGCTFFAIMIADLGSFSKALSCIGLGAALVTAVFYAIGIVEGIRNLFASDKVGTFIERLTANSLVTYVAYAILLAGLILYFIAGINRKRTGRTKKVLLIVGAIGVYASFIVFSIIENSAPLSFNELFSACFFDCAAYLAIALSVFRY